ncbi:protein WEAK CHLOROPLAST MOVEMENT UNDER BLUE LIGHT-like 3 [Nicotiana tomentosiformis]|uniref:protein WEAK CHLOROPLAST MOVEMENT UNDER BLUE LIGHT-like 3 n=1 Tax=Nicotiana tomentosiformis TaxID=4098 RepID=UPI00388C6C98
MIVGRLPSLPTFSEEALKEARELKTPDMGGGSSAGDPFRDCFAGVDDASDIGDVSLFLEEAQRFISRAISKFRADHSQCEVELQKVSGERDALRLLYGLKDEVIKDLHADLAKAREEEAELDKQKKTIDRLDAEKKTILAKLLSADVQLRNVKQKGSAQAKRIGEIEARLAEAKAEVESSKVMTDKSIAVYRADAEAAQTEARSAADAADTRAHWIHARGFDLAEEIKKAKELEADAEALVSDGNDNDDDDDDDADDDRKGGYDDEGEPGGEETALDDNPEA